MTVKIHTIEIDEATAATLQSRARERGVSVSRLVSELVAGREPSSFDQDDMAELDRRWAAIEASQATIPHGEVVRWLDTWGTPGFKAWAKR